jgi:hypothetical protein
MKIIRNLKINLFSFLILTILLQTILTYKKQGNLTIIQAKKSDY